MRVWVRPLLAILLCIGWSVGTSGCIDGMFGSDSESAEEPTGQASDDSSEQPEGDEAKGEGTAEATREDLEERIDELEDSVERRQEISSNEMKIVEELETLRKYASRAETLKSDLATSLERWREATRQSFQGVQLPKIQTVDGRTFSDVTLTGVSDDTITITHSGGEETLQIVDLPVSLRRNVIHEPTALARREQ